MRPHAPSLALLSCFFSFSFNGAPAAPNRGPVSISASPNPFNPSTMIQYELPFAGHVTISIYNVRGRHVATIVDEEKSAGWHTAQWRGRDQSGGIVASGMYFAGIEYNKAARAIKLVLLK